MLFRSLGLTASEVNDLVAFLLSLTDDRVSCHADVFDHPELPIPMGQRDTPVPGTSLARDIIATVPATGKFGLRAAGRECFPNSGDLFDSVNVDDRRGLQRTFKRIIRSGDDSGRDHDDRDRDNSDHQRSGRFGRN